VAAQGRAPVKRKRLSASERRELIIAAAQETFVAEGYAGARTRVIAERAGITEAILYKHVASKDELFEVAVLQPVREQSVRMADVLRESIRTAEAAGVDDREALLRDAHTIVLNGLQKFLPLLGVAILADRREATQEYRHQLYTAMADVLGDVGRDLGPVRGVGDDPLLLTLLAMSLGPVLDALFREVELDVDAVAAQTAALIVHGLAQPPRRTKPATTPAPRQKPRTRSGG
jgi:AcrR family transcriptional regulator